MSDTSSDPSDGPPPLIAGEPVLDVFCRPAELLPSTTMRASSSPTEWPDGPTIELPATYAALRDISSRKRLRTTCSTQWSGPPLHIFDKLGVTDRVAAVARAHDSGILTSGS